MSFTSNDNDNGGGADVSNQPTINFPTNDEVDMDDIWRMYEDLPPTRQLLETGDYIDFSAVMNTSAFSLLMMSLGSNDSDRQRSHLMSAGADTFKMVVDSMTLYVTPVIIVIGVVGNALSLAVFSLTYLQRLSSSLYLSMLSVADIVFLLALLVVWLERVDDHRVHFGDWTGSSWSVLEWSNWNGWSESTSAYSRATAGVRRCSTRHA